jgi:ADP-ribose diphosphatase
MGRSANAVHGPIADAPAESVISHRQVLGVVDAARVPARAGAAAEHEDIVPVRASIDAALVALSGGAVRNGPLIVALQWLALNRSRLAEIVRTGSASP